MVSTNAEKVRSYAITSTSTSEIFNVYTLLEFHKESWSGLPSQKNVKSLHWNLKYDFILIKNTYVGTNTVFKPWSRLIIKIFTFFCLWTRVQRGQTKHHFLCVLMICPKVILYFFINYCAHYMCLSNNAEFLADCKSLLSFKGIVQPFELGGVTRLIRQ